MLFELIYSGFLLMSTYCVVWPMSLKYVRDIFPAEIYQRSLQDRLHILIDRYIPNIAIYKPISDYFSLTCVILGSLYISDYRFIQFLCLCFAMRCLFFSVTILPTPSRKNYKSRWIDAIFTGGCNDLMVSGHILHMYTPLYWLYQQNMIYTWFAVTWLCAIVACGTIIIGSRSHYTIDVITVFPVVNFVYSLLM